ncbi:hypothetical protein MMC25_005161 [Agyrium rufum]|nr:hypothetical protein [Agyrium rufum]
MFCTSAGVRHEIICAKLPGYGSGAAGMATAAEQSVPGKLLGSTPYFDVPGRSLYRRLLRGASRARLEEDGGTLPLKLRLLITSSFSKNAGLQSPRTITQELDNGRQLLRALTLLDSEDTDQQDRFQVRTKLSAAIAQLPFPNSLKKQPPPPTKAKHKFPPGRKIVIHEDTFPILSRPRASVPGKRHVPTLVNANGIPFLRYKKPQPALLSRIIRHRIKSHQTLTNHVHRMEKELAWAQGEDVWDAVTRKLLDPIQEEVVMQDTVGDLSSAKERGPKWAVAVHEGIGTCYDKMATASRRNQEMAMKMWNIVKKEAALAEEEERARHDATRLTEGEDEDKLQQHTSNEKMFGRRKRIRQASSCFNP